MKNVVKILITILLVAFFSWVALVISSVDETSGFSETLQYLQSGLVATILIYIVYDKLDINKESK